MVKVDGGSETHGKGWKHVGGGYGCSECVGGGQKWVVEVRNTWRLRMCGGWSWGGVKTHG